MAFGLATRERQKEKRRHVRPIFQRALCEGGEEGEKKKLKGLPLYPHFGAKNCVKKC